MSLPRQICASPLLLLLLPLAACSPQPQPTRQTTTLSPEAEQAKVHGEAVRAALQPIHAAMPSAGAAVLQPCPALDGKALNISWGRLNHLITGEALDPHGLDSADILPFNDYEFQRPEHFRGEDLETADADDLARVERAFADLLEIRYVRVARTGVYNPPIIDSNDSFTPGSLAGVLVVFDRQGTQICAVEAEVASKNEVSVQRRSETQSEDELRRAKQAALLVDMTQRLAHALRAAARPGTDSSPAL